MCLCSLFSGNDQILFPCFVRKKEKYSRRKGLINTERFLYKICIKSGLLILSEVTKAA